MQPNQEQNSRNEGQMFLMGLAFTLRSVTAVADTFLHRGFGERYFGLQALGPVLIIPMFGMLFPEHDQGPLFSLLIAYLLALLAVRIDTVRRRPAAGVHSRYSGTPYLCSILPRVSELTIKRFVEPFLLFGLSALVLPLDVPLGAYLLLTSFACLATVNSDEAFERARARELYDSLLEQQQMGHRVRSHSGDRF